MNSKTIGDISEAFCTAAFLSKGFTVLKPYGDNNRYDIVIDRGSGFERIQVKTAKYSDTEKCLKISMCSSTFHRNKKHKSYAGEVEFIAAWSEHTKKVYMIPLSEVDNARETRLRLHPAKNKQKKNVRMAVDYEI